LLTVCDDTEGRKKCFFENNTHTPFNGPLSRTTWVSRYQKGKTSLDFTEARDSEWQWHQLGHMQVCTLLQTDNHASTQPLSFVQGGCPSCCQTNSVIVLKGNFENNIETYYYLFKTKVMFVCIAVYLYGRTSRCVQPIPRESLATECVDNLMLQAVTYYDGFKLVTVRDIDSTVLMHRVS